MICQTLHEIGNLCNHILQWFLVDEDAPKNENLVEDLVSEPSNPELTMLEVYAQREANINENKSTIARLCEEILENPDAHVRKIHFTFKVVLGVTKRMVNKRKQCE